MKDKVIVVIIIVLFLGITTGTIMPIRAQPSEVWVPTQYGTIQAGVNAVADDGIVHVSSGTYYEHVTIGKPLMLMGEDRDTTIIDGSGTGTVVYVGGTDHVEIGGFTVTNGGVDGIAVWYSDHNKLTDLNVHSNGRHGVLTQHSGYNFISNVDAYSNGESGIGLGWVPSHSIITNCNSSFNSHSGITVYDWPVNVTIIDCISSDNSLYGIIVGWTRYGLIKGCTANDNGWEGIQLDTDIYSTVEDCHVESNGLVGIRVYAHNPYYIHNTVTNCEVVSNERGIVVGPRHGYNWYLNTTITNCDFLNNEVGVAIDGTDNKIYHNNLIDNTIQASDYGANNQWDDNYPSGGNHWSDYTGGDLYGGPYQNETGSDGIGDTAYFIAPFNQDNFPLMEPWTPVPPVEDTEAYLNYVNETIQDPPDEIFNRPEEDVSDIKNDLSDLLNDTRENINEDNYGSAIEKLSKITDKIYEEIVESAERQELISLIDDLIAYLETLL